VEPRVADASHRSIRGRIKDLPKATAVNLLMLRRINLRGVFEKPLVDTSARDRFSRLKARAAARCQTTLSVRRRGAVLMPWFGTELLGSSVKTKSFATHFESALLNRTRLELDLDGSTVVIAVAVRTSNRSRTFQFRSRDTVNSGPLMSDMRTRHPVFDVLKCGRTRCLAIDPH
jgi:hypothetical protein